MKQQQGFTLIELIVVIVILGILAATAVPKFIDLKADAEDAGVRGVAGGISSAGAMNFALRSLHSGSGVATSGVSCTTLVANPSFMETNPANDGYSITGTVTPASPNCTVSRGSATATAVVPSIN